MDRGVRAGTRRPKRGDSPSIPRPPPRLTPPATETVRIRPGWSGSERRTGHSRGDRDARISSTVPSHPDRCRPPAENASVTPDKAPTPAKKAPRTPGGGGETAGTVADTAPFRDESQLERLRGRPEGDESHFQRPKGCPSAVASRFERLQGRPASDSTHFARQFGTRKVEETARVARRAAWEPMKLKNPLGPAVRRGLDAKSSSPW